MPDHSPQTSPGPPRHVIGKAIEDIVAARLGRGFVPLGLLGVVAVGEILAAEGGERPGWLLLGGAVASGVVMLAYGLRIVQKAFGHPRTFWAGAAMIGSPLPLVFSIYVFGVRGLRALASGGGLASIALAILFTAVGVWVLRSWMRVVEVERLARVMADNSEEEAGPA